MKSAVLFVSPSVRDARILAPMLEAVGIPFSHAADLAQARELLESELIGAVLTDVRLSDGTWKDVIGTVARIGRGVAVVVTGILLDAHLWIDVLESGAYDLLPRPFNRLEVQRVLAKAVDRPPLLTAAISAA